MDRYKRSKDFITHKLRDELPKSLYYHSLNHVMDVLKAAEMLAKLENIEEGDLELLRIAVLFHDSGFTLNSRDHEELSCMIARDNLPGFGYNIEELEKICGMIMATRIPQSPQNLLEMIICDADLDYLGRDDFFKIANTLYEELGIYGMITNERDWNRLQVSFLESHKYFTDSAKDLREGKKREHLQQLKQIVNSYS